MLTAPQDVIRRHAITPDFYPRRPRLRRARASLPDRVPTSSSVTDKQPSPERIKPTYIDTIETVSEPLAKMDGMSPLVHLLTMAYQVDIKESEQRDRLSTLMHTMAAATPLPSSSRRYTIEEFRNSFISLLRPVLHGMAGLTEFCDAVDSAAADAPEEFRDFWTIEGRSLLRELAMNDGARGGAARGMDVPFVDSFVRNQDSRVALGKRKEILALVPGDTKEGDQIELAKNATHTRIKRRMSEGDIELGEAFVQFVN